MRVRTKVATHTPEHITRPAGTIIDHPEAHILVAIGIAEPADPAEPSQHAEPAEVEETHGTTNDGSQPANESRQAPAPGDD